MKIVSIHPLEALANKINHVCRWN